MQFDYKVTGGTIRRQYSHLLGTWEAVFIADPILPSSPQQPLPLPPTPPTAYSTGRYVDQSHRTTNTTGQAPKQVHVNLSTQPAAIPYAAHSDGKPFRRTLVAFSAAALAITGAVAFMETLGADMGLKHALHTRLYPGHALRAGKSAVFDTLEPRYRIMADETCLHTKPRNRSLAEVCIAGGGYVHGKPLAPENKSDKPEWLKVHVFFSDAGSNPTHFNLFLPMKDLQADPVRPTRQNALEPALKR